jgi:y4mF family transcriptional regulator
VLGAEVRRKRKLLRLSQQELAELSGCGPAFLYDLERGKPSIRLDKLVPVLEMLGLRLKLEPRVAGLGTVSGDWISSAADKVTR